MRAVKDSLATPLKRGIENLEEALLPAIIQWLPRWVMMSLASATGSVVKGTACCRVTEVLNRSAAWRMGRGKDASSWI